MSISHITPRGTGKGMGEWWEGSNYRYYLVSDDVIRCNKISIFIFELFSLVSILNDYICCCFWISHHVNLFIWTSDTEDNAIKTKIPSLRDVFLKYFLRGTTKSSGHRKHGKCSLVSWISVRYFNGINVFDWSIPRDCKLRFCMTNASLIYWEQLCLHL